MEYKRNVSVAIAPFINLKVRKENIARLSVEVAILITEEKLVRLKIRKLRLNVLRAKRTSKFIGIDFKGHRTFFVQRNVKLCIKKAKFQRKETVKR